MQALPVINDLDEFTDPCSCIDDIAIATAVDFFLLERSHEFSALALFVTGRPVRAFGAT